MKSKPKKLKRDRKNITLILVLVVILAASVYAFTPLKTRITQGLDIQGGLSVIMTASSLDGEAISADDMDEAVSIVTARVNKLGASEATVQQEGDSSILIQIPGLEDSESALETIGATGVLEFVNVADITDDDVKESIENGETGMTLDSDSYTAFMTGDSISSVSVSQASTGSAYYSVNLDLDNDGTDSFAEVTSELAPTYGQIAIVLDGVVESAPSVESEITDGNVQITGSYTVSEAKDLKTVLDSGSLPVSLDFSSSYTVGPTLGQDSLHAGVLAALIGLAVVALYLLFFYRGLGLLTAGAIGVFGAVYLGLLAVLSHFGLFALSLPGIAGIVLTIGLAADSSILVLERFREEIRMGRSVRAASITGVRHAIGTSIDADLVTLVSALALFFIAVGPVKGFGLTLALGIACDVFTMLVFKAPAIRLLAPKQIAKHPVFWGISEDLADEDVAEQKGGVDNA